jgi:hypothetical protein
VASLNVKLDKELANAPWAGFELAALLDHDAVTVGDAVPDFHMVAVMDKLNPVMVVPVLFCNSHVPFPLDAVLLPKKDMFAFPYQPPEVPVV